MRNRLVSYEERKKQLNEYKKAWNKKHPGAHRSAHYKNRYGITLAEFDAIAESQDWKCAICRQEKKLSLDHCHSTNQIRGLLCKDCNFGLGNFYDNVFHLKRAIEYLRLSQ